MSGHSETKQWAELAPAVQRKPDQQRGFTLLEILIVAFILALIAGTVVVTAPPSTDKDDAQTAAVVFKEKFAHARQMALVGNWVIGVDIDERGYRFFHWQQGTWQAMADPALAEVELGEVELELRLGDYGLLDNIIDGDRQAVFRSTERDEEGERPVQPRLLIFESTDFVPFSLSFRNAFSGLTFYANGSDGLHLVVQELEP